MKTLIVLSAMPGSGKSTWAKQYQAEHSHTLIVSSDAIRYELTGQSQDFSRQKEVWELFSLRIHEYAQKYDDVTVILDALNDLNCLREKYVKENPEFDQYVLVLLPRTVEQIRYYNKERNFSQVVPDEQLEMLIQKWEEPTEDIKALFDKVIEVHW
ncbi:MAG: ATP-binding protein [Bacilli bacterium]|nr:ATP-binding protein [Bacilli bacterium]